MGYWIEFHTSRHVRHTSRGHLISKFIPKIMSFIPKNVWFIPPNLCFIPRKNHGYLMILGTGYWVLGYWVLVYADWTTGHHDILWLVDWMSDDNSDNPIFWLDALVQFGGLIGSYIGSRFLTAGRDHSDSWHSDTDSWLVDLSWLWDLIGAIRCCRWLGHVIGWMIPETRCELMGW